MINVLMVIAQENFRDEEYKIPLNILQKKNILVLTASDTTEMATGMFGFAVKPDMAIESAKEISFDALLLVGGDGAKSLWENKYLQQLVKDFYGQKKLIGAICLAPIILGNAGILRKKNITVHDSAKNKLKGFDAIYKNHSIEQDEMILTANGPSASTIFGHRFAEILMNR